MKRFKLERRSADLRAPGVEFPRLADRVAYDASLLFRRMATLHINRDKLAKDDPLLFRELQALCTLCRSHGRCARDLAGEFKDPGWQDYCPNTATLSMLTTPDSAICSRLASASIPINSVFAEPQDTD